MGIDLGVRLSVMLSGKQELLPAVLVTAHHHSLLGVGVVLATSCAMFVFRVLPAKSYEAQVYLMSSWSADRLIVAIAQTSPAVTAVLLCDKAGLMAKIGDEKCCHGLVQVVVRPEQGQRLPESL